MLLNGTDEDDDNVSELHGAKEMNQIVS